MFLRLAPSIPVTVTSKDNRKGAAIALQDPGEDSDLRMVVVLEDGGEIWCVRTPELRVRANWTMGRRLATGVGERGE